MTESRPAIYTAEAHVTGGRAEGHGRTSDGALEVDLRTPPGDGRRAAEAPTPSSCSRSATPPASRARWESLHGAADRRPGTWRSTRGSCCCPTADGLQARRGARGHPSLGRRRGRGRRAGESGAPGVPVLERHARQHRGHAHRERARHRRDLGIDGCLSPPTTPGDDAKESPGARMTDGRPLTTLERDQDPTLRSRHDPQQAHDLPGHRSRDPDHRAGGRRLWRQRKRCDRLEQPPEDCERKPRDRRRRDQRPRQDPRRLEGQHPLPVQGGLRHQERLQRSVCQRLAAAARERQADRRQRGRRLDARNHPRSDGQAQVTYNGHRSTPSRAPEARRHRAGRA